MSEKKVTYTIRPFNTGLVTGVKGDKNDPDNFYNYHFLYLNIWKEEPYILQQKKERSVSCWRAVTEVKLW